MADKSVTTDSTAKIQHFPELANMFCNISEKMPTHTFLRYLLLSLQGGRFCHDRLGQLLICSWQKPFLRRLWLVLPPVSVSSSPPC